MVLRRVASHLDDKNNPEHLLWRGTLPDRMLRIRHDDRLGPNPFPEGAGLERAERRRLRQVVTFLISRAPTRARWMAWSSVRNPSSSSSICRAGRSTPMTFLTAIWNSAQQDRRATQGMHALDET